MQSVYGSASRVLQKNAGNLEQKDQPLRRLVGEVDGKAGALTWSLKRGTPLVHAHQFGREGAMGVGNAECARGWGRGRGKRLEMAK